MMEIQTLDVNKVKYAPYNPRKISPETLEKLKQSIEAFGYVEPIIVNKRTMHVVGGNQRLKAMKELGIKEVEAVIVDLDEKDEKVLNLALNKLMGQWDIELLRQVLSELDETQRLLAGFTDLEIESLLADSYFPPAEPEDTPEESGLIFVITITAETEEERDNITQLLNDNGIKYKVQIKGE